MCFPTAHGLFLMKPFTMNQVNCTGRALAQGSWKKLKGNGRSITFRLLIQNHMTILERKKKQRQNQKID